VECAAVVTAAAVAVEEAVLDRRVDVVATDAGREAALVVVGRAGTLDVEPVDVTVHVVVDAVGALGVAGRGSGCAALRQQAVGVVVGVDRAAGAVAAAGRSVDRVTSAVATTCGERDHGHTDLDPALHGEAPCSLASRARASATLAPRGNRWR
jgi:hypothetical protein